MKKFIVVAAAFSMLATVSLTSPLTAYASVGWVEEGEHWYYYDNNGEPLTEKWKTYEDVRYYFDESGQMLQDCLLESNDNWYYFNHAGKMVKEEWRYLEVDEEASWLYFGSDGKALAKKNNSFKKSIGDTIYIFDDKGRLLYGWIDENGDVLEDSKSPFADGMYYAGADGIVYKEKWMQYDGFVDNELKSQMAENSYMDYSAIWLYFGSNGKKVKTDADATKLVQKNLDGKTYGFDENGVMMEWWWIDTTSGSTVTKFYSAYDSGLLLKDQWIWMYPSETQSIEDYDDTECSWWRTDNKGILIKDKIKTVNGKKYAFDDIGRMQTGFVMFKGTTEFVAQYDVDAWESVDFINSGVIGIEQSDLYLFSANELNEGAMQTGGEIKVDLADGVHTFGFDSKGKAYGNKNTLQKKNNKFYINGLRLEADAEFGYGIVEYEDPATGDYVYKVVDTSGTIVKGKESNKAVLSDKNGGWIIIIGGEFKAYVTDDYKPRWYDDGTHGVGYYHYDSDNKDDKYAKGKIAGADTPVNLNRLPAEEKLNFN